MYTNNVALPAAAAAIDQHLQAHSSSEFVAEYR